ncbi:hypothetical protein FR483_n182R [Paramecium bursaria Chlorella virus FR483]|uniref:Uncharacterized protein n182R n=1 Tax=Paramecium bursaria Chlorella virus FR483 TaxID=399781 RepID=A7J6N6_PBCVF|nr:hypothetical protein FR483_n182R [Paramecium bursaria Chlorella virus FR483]ABT15467.1 hypothetical protein FR483_n182R [Paramecium bursaria Chlorella virus FR483]
MEAFSQNREIIVKVVIHPREFVHCLLSAKRKPVIDSSMIFSLWNKDSIVITWYIQKQILFKQCICPCIHHGVVFICWDELKCLFDIIKHGLAIAQFCFFKVIFLDLEQFDKFLVILCEF